MGPKGAGKSTLFKMMTMEIPMSANSDLSILNQLSKKFDMNEFGIDLGLSPQNNICNEFLSV